MKTHGHLVGYPRGCAPVEYTTWGSMIDRCENPNNGKYADYGGRGIQVCLVWRLSFPAFLAYVGPRPQGHTIDRINVNGHYEPGNVRWVTAEVEVRNRRNTRRLRLLNAELPMVVWATKVGIDYDTLSARLSAGWSDAETILTPRGCRRESVEVDSVIRSTEQRRTYGHLPAPHRAVR